MLSRRRLAVLALAALVAGCRADGEGLAEPVPLHVERLGQARLRHLLTGRLAAERAAIVKVPPSRSNPLELRFVVEPGTRVEAGDVLFELDNSQLASNLDQRRMDVAQRETGVVTARATAAGELAEAYFKLRQSQSELERAEIDAEVPVELKSRLDYERLQLARDKARLQVEESTAALESARQAAEARIGIARLELSRAENELRRAENGIETLSLRAPEAGVVLLEENRREDRVWQLGDSAFVGDLLARIPDPASLVVRCRLFDVDDGMLEAGQKASVLLDAFPGEPLAGVVGAVDRVASQDRRDARIRAFEATVELEEPVDAERMLAGMAARVAVERVVAPAAGESGVWVVPRQSLSFRSETPRLLLGDGSWREVVVRDCDARRCVVDGEGLSDGEALQSIVARGGRS